MLAVAAGSKMPIVSCARDFIFEPGTTAETRQVYLNHQAQIRTTYRDPDRWSAQEVAEVALRRIRPNPLGEPTAVLLHRNVFDRFGLFNPHLASCCDLEYWIRVASHTGTIHIRDVLATFRVHAGSMSAYLTQTAARRYRSEILDPLLIVHDYAFHPVYGELRRVAERCRPPIQLSREFWKRALALAGMRKWQKEIDHIRTLPYERNGERWPATI